MSFNTIRTAILNKLNTLVPATLKEVYGYKINPLEEEFGSYPVAEVIESGNEADYFTNAENLRTFAYEIYIFVEAENQGIENAYTALRSAVDTLIDTFDIDYTLGGAAEGGVDAAAAGFSDFRGRSGRMAVATVVLKCRKIKSVN